MKPQFNIHTPLSVADIENIRRRNDHKLRVTQWFSLPVTAGSFCVGWLVWYLLSGLDTFPGIDGYKLTESSIVLWRILTVPIGFMACVLVFFLWNELLNHLNETKRLLSPLSLSDSEAALSLTKQYADLDAYRLDVIVHRQLTTGDFEAMKSFAKQQESVAAERVLEEKQKEAFRKLHEVR